MRSWPVAIVVLMVGAATASAQSWADKLFKDKVTHDFGVVPYGAQLYHRFTMTNIYAVKLELTEVNPLCTCVTVTPSTRTLEPRQTAYIDVMMDGRKFKEKKTVRIRVTVGPQFVQTAELVVTAHPRADIVYNPGVVDFGVVARGQTPTQSLDIEYAGTLDLRLTEIVKTDAPLEATLNELYRRPGQVGYKVSVKLKPDASAGGLKHELFVKTNDPNTPLLPVVVEAVVQAPLSVVPSTVSIGTLKAGTTVSRRIQVRGNKPFRVVAIEGLGNGISADLPTGAAQVQTINLKCEPNQAGNFSRTLKIQTDQNVDGLTATIEGMVVP